jgi:hypothetical protein
MCGKLYDHFSMAEGREMHPLKPVMLHPWGTDDSTTQLKIPCLKKGELLKLCSTLPLRHFPGPTLHYKLVLMEGDLLGKALGIFTGRG